MVRGALLIVFLICVIGLFASDSKGAFFVIGFFTFIILGLVQQIVDWLGLDDHHSGSKHTTSEFFIDSVTNKVVWSQNAKIQRDIGDLVILKATEYRILDAKVNEDGDLIYLVDEQ